MEKRRGRFCFGLGIENDRWVGSDRVYSVSETPKMKKVRRMPNLENLVEPRGIEPLTSWLPAMRSPS